MSALPSSMSVIEIAPGARLAQAQRPVPVPTRDQVLIEVAAAGLNRADLGQRAGKYPPPPGAPEWPGLEVSGRVVALGADVREFAPGDEVCALLQGGGYARYCVASTGTVLPRPRAVCLRDAAALPEAAFTVYSNLYEFARLLPGERVLIHGGTSGIGTFAIQLASALGSIVLATAGSADKCALCVSLGAAHAINYREEDFVAVARASSDGTGVDVILDMVGGSYAQRNLDALAPEGRIVVIATPGGVQGTIDLAQMMRKRAHLTGSTLRPRDVAFKQGIKEQLLAKVWPLLESGAVRPIVDRVFAFAEAEAAHAYMESGVHKGKLLLAWD